MKKGKQILRILLCCSIIYIKFFFYVESVNICGKSSKQIAHKVITICRRTVGFAIERVAELDKVNPPMKTKRKTLNICIKYID